MLKRTLLVLGLVATFVVVAQSTSVLGRTERTLTQQEAENLFGGQKGWSCKTAVQCDPMSPNFYCGITNCSFVPYESVCNLTNEYINNNGSPQDECNPVGGSSDKECHAGTNTTLTCYDFYQCTWNSQTARCERVLEGRVSCAYAKGCYLSGVGGGGAGD